MILNNPDTPSQSETTATAARKRSRTGKPRYTLEELLAQCDPNEELTQEDRDWLDAPLVGRELPDWEPQEDEDETGAR